MRSRQLLRKETRKRTQELLSERESHETLSRLLEGFERACRCDDPQCVCVLSAVAAPTDSLDGKVRRFQGTVTQGRSHVSQLPASQRTMHTSVESLVRGTVLVGEPCEQCTCDVQCRVETLLEVADDSTSIVEEVARVQCRTVTCVLCQVARKSANFRREFKGNVSASCTAVMAILSKFGSDEMRR